MSQDNRVTDAEITSDGQAKAPATPARPKTSALAKTGRGAQDTLRSPVQPAPSLIDLLHRANQAVNSRFTNSVGEDGPTPRQLAVLTSIAASDGLSQTDISDATGIDRATTAEIVGRLTRLGLVKRRRTRQDARTYAVSLTEKGQAVCDHANDVSARVESDLLNLLPMDERGVLIDVLGRLVKASGGLKV